MVNTKRKYTYYDVFNMHLDYLNNFLTIDRFAEYYSISKNDAMILINHCRTLLGDDLSLNDISKMIDMNQVVFEFKQVIY